MAREALKISSVDQIDNVVPDPAQISNCLPRVFLSAAFVISCQNLPSPQKADSG